MKMKMKPIMAILIASVLLAVSLGGCWGTDEPTVEVSLTLRNATEYEIEGLALQYFGGGEAHRKNPMEYPINETDVGLKPGEEREYDFSVWESELQASWGVNMSVVGVENLCYSSGSIVLGGAKGFEITYGGMDDGDPFFDFTAIEG